MLFTYFLVAHHNLNSSFSPLDLFQRLRHHNASIYTTTESAMGPFPDIYRSVVEIPQETASAQSDIWTVAGSPKAQVYQLGSPIGAMMYQALAQVFEVEDAPTNVAIAHKASQCSYSKLDPDGLFQRCCEHTPNNESYGQNVQGLPRVTLVERVCAIGEHTSTLAMVAWGLYYKSPIALNSTTSTHIFTTEHAISIMSLSERQELQALIALSINGRWLHELSQTFRVMQSEFNGSMARKEGTPEQQTSEGIAQIEVGDMIRPPLDPGAHLGGDSGTSANLEHLLSCALKAIEGENADRT